MIPVDVFLRNHCILLLKRICSHPCCSSPPLCGDAVGTLRDLRPPKGKCSILSIVHCPELAQSGPELHGVPSGRWDSGGLSWGPRTTGYARPGPQVSSLASSSRKLAVLKLGPRVSCTCSRSLVFSRPRAGPGDSHLQLGPSPRLHLSCSLGSQQNSRAFSPPLGWTSLLPRLQYPFAIFKTLPVKRKRRLITHSHLLPAPVLGRHPRCFTQSLFSFVSFNLLGLNRSISSFEKSPKRSPYPSIRVSRTVTVST